MNQPGPSSWGGPPRQQQWPSAPTGYEPVPYAVAPPVEQHPGMFRYLVLGCATLVVLGVLVLVGLMLVPRSPATPVVVSSGTTTGTGSSGPVVATVAAPSSRGTVPVGGYSCGATSSGHAVTVVNGTVPCDHAVAVAAQWLSTGSTPGYGAGSAGTMYSWSCSTTSTGAGWCTSKMGSHLSIGS